MQGYIQFIPEELEYLLEGLFVSDELPALVQLDLHQLVYLVLTLQVLR